MTPSHLVPCALALLVALGLSCSSSEEDEDSATGGSGGEPSTPIENGGTGGGGAGGTGGTGGAVTSDPNDIYACTGQSQCLLVEAARDCCVPHCGTQDVSFFSAVHRDHIGTWHEGQVCAGCLEPCSDAERDAFRQSTRSIVASCQGGRCRAIDLADTPVTTCSADTDCRLRWGLQCCEDRTDNLEFLTAVSDPNALKGYMCPEEFVNCGPVPSKPPEALAVCRNGKCAVSFGDEDAGVGDAGSGAAADASAPSGSTTDASASDAAGDGS